MAEMGQQLVWMAWQSIRIVGVSACVIFILHQKIQETVKRTFWYRLTLVVTDKVQRPVKLLLCYIKPLSVDRCGFSRPHVKLDRLQLICDMTGKKIIG